MRRRRARPACVHTEHTRAITRGGRRTHTRYRGPATYPTSTPAARRSHPATRGVCGPTNTHTDTHAQTPARSSAHDARQSLPDTPTRRIRCPRNHHDLSHTYYKTRHRPDVTQSPTSRAPRLTRSLLPNANRQRPRDPKPRSVPHPRFPSTLGHTEHTLALCWYHRPSTPRSPLSRIQIQLPSHPSNMASQLARGFARALCTRAFHRPVGRLNLAGRRSENSSSYKSRRRVRMHTHAAAANAHCHEAARS